MVLITGEGLPTVTPEPDTKIRVDKDDLQEFAKLFTQVARTLREQGEDDQALECEQTAEFIGGYYLPYPESQDCTYPRCGHEYPNQCNGGRK
jgi:hypothetical protein